MLILGDLIVYIEGKRPGVTDMKSKPLRSVTIGLETVLGGPQCADTAQLTTSWRSLVAKKYLAKINTMERLSVCVWELPQMKLASGSSHLYSYVDKVITKLLRFV